MVNYREVIHDEYPGATLYPCHHCQIIFLRIASWGRKHCSRWCEQITARRFKEQEKNLRRLKENIKLNKMLDDYYKKINPKSRRIRNSLALEKTGYKICTVCKRKKLLSEFWLENSSEKKCKYYSRCIVCSRIMQYVYTYKMNWREAVKRYKEVQRIKREYEASPITRKKAKNIRKKMLRVGFREEFEKLFAVFGCRCVACGKKCSLSEITRDHITPVFLGGTNHISNIQPLCVRCNSSKGLSDTDFRPFIPDWVQQKTLEV